MKPSTYTVAAYEQLTSTGTADVHTAALMPLGCSAILVSVETTAARVTLDGSAPGGTTGHVIATAQAPLLLPVGQGTTIKVASTAAANAIVDITYLA